MRCAARARPPPGGAPPPPPPPPPAAPLRTAAAAAATAAATAAAAATTAAAAAAASRRPAPRGGGASARRVELPEGTKPYAADPPRQGRFEAFLTDEATARRLAAAAGLSAQDVAREIGEFAKVASSLRGQGTRSSQTGSRPAASRAE